MGLPAGGEWKRASLRTAIALGGSLAIVLICSACGLTRLSARSLLNLSLGVGLVTAWISLVEGRRGEHSLASDLGWALGSLVGLVLLQAVASDAYQAGLLETGDPRAASQRASSLLTVVWKLRELYFPLATLVALPIASGLFARLQGWALWAQVLSGALVLGSLGALPWIYLEFAPRSVETSGASALFLLPLCVAVGLWVLDLVDRRLIGERDTQRDPPPERRKLWFACTLVLTLLAGVTFVWIRSDPTLIRVGWEWESGGALRLTLDAPRWGPACAQELEVQEVLAAQPSSPGSRTYEYVPRSSFRLAGERPPDQGLLRVQRTWSANYAGPEALIHLRGVVRLRNGTEKRFEISLERGGGYWHTPLWVR